MLMRDLRFRSLELRLLAGTALATPLAILVAVLGYGPWAFITFELTVATTSTVLVWLLLPWRPAFSYSIDSLRDLGRFGGNALGSRFFTDLGQIADKLLVGRFLGATPLGAYTLAYNLVLSPFSRVVGPLQEVLFPAFSRIQDERERVAALWLRATRLLVALVLPAMIGLVIVAPEFTRVVLGHRWSAAVPLIRILAWVGLLQAVQGLNPGTLQARNKAGELMRFTWVALIASVAAFAVGLHWGVVGVAASFVIVSLALTPYITGLTMRNLGIPLRALLLQLRGPVEATAGMTAVVILVRTLLIHVSAGDAVILVATVASGLLAYLPLCLWRASSIVADARGLLRRRTSALVPQDALGGGVRRPG
jgi:O-antigen/teichoic acid export membrane protein